MKRASCLLLSIALGSLLACMPEGADAPDHRNRREHAQRKRDALLGPPRASVLLLGTFDIGGAVTSEEETSLELQEVVDKLVEYAPTMVAVAVPIANQSRLDDRYSSYLRRDDSVGGGEIDPLALRVAEAMDHERIWAIDAPELTARPVDLRAYAIQHDQTDRLNDGLVSRYDQWFERERKYQATESIEDNLVWLNDARHLADAHGRNLVGNFDLGEGADYAGPDALAGWYSRHLRMFANLQRILRQDGERILVVIDAVHVSLLRHSVVASPRYELIEVNEFLGVPQGAQRQVAPLL